MESAISSWAAASFYAGWAVAWACKAKHSQDSGRGRLSRHVRAALGGVGGGVGGVMLWYAFAPGELDLLTRAILAFFALGVFVFYGTSPEERERIRIEAEEKAEAKKAARAKAKASELAPPARAAAGARSVPRLPAVFTFDHSDKHGEITRRKVRIEALGSYRHETYLCGYCYLRNDERTFSMGRVVGKLRHEKTGETFSTWELMTSTRERRALTFDRSEFV